MMDRLEFDKPRAWSKLKSNKMRLPCLSFKFHVTFVHRRDRMCMFIAPAASGGRVARPPLGVVVAFAGISFERKCLY